MRRREFITLVGGAVASPFVARAQQPNAVRRIGVLMNFRSDASEGQARIAVFAQALQKLGWTDGDNVRTDIRWAADDMELFRKYSKELVELNRMSSSRPPAKAWRNCNGPLEACQSCSQMSLTRWERVTSLA
jgi:hypothetical protein